MQPDQPTTTAAAPLQPCACFAYDAESDEPRTPTTPDCRATPMPEPTETAACRCDGRYDGCEHGRRCPNTGGSSHSPYFCADCDPRRRAHITANLNAIVEAFRG